MVSRKIIAAMKFLLLLALAHGLAGQTVESRLAQPLLNQKQTMVEAQIYLA